MASHVATVAGNVSLQSLAWTSAWFRGLCRDVLGLSGADTRVEKFRPLIDNFGRFV